MKKERSARPSNLDVRPPRPFPIFILFLLAPGAMTTLAYAAFLLTTSLGARGPAVRAWYLVGHVVLVALTCGVLALYLSLSRSSAVADVNRCEDREPPHRFVKVPGGLEALALALGAWLAALVPLALRRLSAATVSLWNPDVGLLGTLFTLYFFLVGRLFLFLRGSRMIKAGAAGILFFTLLPGWHRLTLDFLQFPALWYPWTRGLIWYTVILTVIALAICRRGRCFRRTSMDGRTLRWGSLEGILAAFTVLVLGWLSMTGRMDPVRCLSDATCQVRLLPLSRAGRTLDVLVSSGPFGESVYRPARRPPARFHRIRGLRLVAAAVVSPDAKRLWVLERRYHSRGFLGYHVAYEMALWDRASGRRVPLPVEAVDDPGRLRVAWSPESDRLAVALNRAPLDIGELRIYSADSKERLRMKLRWPVQDLAWAGADRLVIAVRERASTLRSALLIQVLAPHLEADLFHLPDNGQVLRVVGRPDTMPYIEYRTRRKETDSLRIFRLEHTPQGRWRLHSSSPIPGGRAFAYTRDSILVLQTDPGSTYQLVLLDGTQLRPRIRYLLPRYRRFRFLGISPGGRRVAFHIQEKAGTGAGDLLILRLDNSNRPLRFYARLPVPVREAAFLSDRYMIVWTGKRLHYLDLKRPQPREDNR